MVPFVFLLVSPLTLNQAVVCSVCHSASLPREVQNNAFTFSSDHPHPHIKPSPLSLKKNPFLSFLVSALSLPLSFSFIPHSNLISTLLTSLALHKKQECTNDTRRPRPRRRTSTEMPPQLVHQKHHENTNTVNNSSPSSNLQ